MFIINRIIDHNTVEVSPQWQWQGRSGNIVRISGINNFNTQIDNAFARQITIQRLNNLLLGREVALTTPANVMVTGVGPNDVVLNCIVNLDQVNVINYLPEVNKP